MQYLYRGRIKTPESIWHDVCTCRVKNKYKVARYKDSIWISFEGLLNSRTNSDNGLMTMAKTTRERYIGMKRAGLFSFMDIRSSTRTAYALLDVITHLPIHSCFLTRGGETPPWQEGSHLWSPSTLPFSKR